jgi:hypothetical protein
MTGDADQIGAANILARKDDREITVYSSKEEVLQVLTERFLKRASGDSPASPEVPFSAQTSTAAALGGSAVKNEEAQT